MLIRGSAHLRLDRDLFRRIGMQTSQSTAVRALFLVLPYLFVRMGGQR